MAGSKLVRIIQEASRNAQPDATDLLLGSVTSVSPLKIKVDNRFELDSSFLVLSTLVRDFSFDMTVNHKTETAEAHTHNYSGRKTFTAHLGLSVGENVLLLRVQGGQKFIVIDRVRSAVV